MKDNGPITRQEHDYDGTLMLVSKTDPKGRITYANDAFVAVSGFRREELIGKAHNVVRHPDMPPAAFADMWATLQDGRPWTALVKNRRKNGDHYWVRANVTPVRDGDRVIEYLSVRIKPPREEIEAAEALYAGMRAGKARVRLQAGRLVPLGIGALAHAFRALSVRARIAASMATIATVAGLAAAIGMPGWTQAGLTVLLAAAAWFWLEREIAAPLSGIQPFVQRLAAGDMRVRLSTRRVDGGRVDQFSDIFRAITQTAINLSAIVQDVQNQVADMRQATSEIAAGNQDLSDRTEQSAASLEQTAASMHQLATTVEQSAQITRTAAACAEEARSSAQQGHAAIGAVVHTMEGITGSSRRIADIVQVIDGIAFQTNILALNAAVEAARAGEAGRGFAVVAAEVRGLAQRSAQSAREIKALIAASVDEVEAGVEDVSRARETIDRLSGEVERAARLIDDIDRAAHEQASGISLVNQAVTQLDQVTQQNAALVEQSAAASASLREQADKLLDAVAILSLSQGAVVAAARKSVA